MTVVFDASSSLARLGGDNGLFRTLVQFFQEDYPALMGQLRGGIERGDLAQVERAAHSLQGLIASFSADGARDSVERLAEHARAGNLSAASDRLPDLGMQIEQLREALSDYVDGLRS
jgi:two-component system, sensor histidine kinase and response regulator